MTIIINSAIPRFHLRGPHKFLCNRLCLKRTRQLNGSWSERVMETNAHHHPNMSSLTPLRSVGPARSEGRARTNAARRSAKYPTVRSLHKAGPRAKTQDRETDKKAETLNPRTRHWKKTEEASRHEPHVVLSKDPSPVQPKVLPFLFVPSPRSRRLSLPFP